MMTDLLIVGGGPVGLVAALHAHRAGLEVVVVERRTGVIDKACGEGLMARGRDLLRELDIQPEGHEFFGITYVDALGRTSVRVPLPRPGIGVRRTSLHRPLLESVLDRGINIVPGTVVGIEHDRTGVTATVRSPAGEVRLGAKHLLGADGLHSTVRRLSGLQGRASSVRRHGLRQHFSVPPWSNDVEVHWGPAGEAYVTPVGPSEVGVAILTRLRLPHQELLSAFPALASRLSGARASSTPRGAGPLWQRSRARTTGRVLLAGDASGYVDALTGDGLSVGLQQAAEAVRAVVAADLRAYETVWRRITLPHAAVAGGLVLATSTPLIHDLVPQVSRAIGPAFAGLVRLNS